MLCCFVGGYFISMGIGALRDGVGQAADELPIVEPAPQPVEITILAAGDNLLHDTISKAAKQADGTYDYKPIYQFVKERISGADIAFVNQETPTNPNRGPSGYPSFNAPPSAVDALIDAGFDVVNFANNHIMDTGAKGVAATYEVWANHPTVQITGIFGDEEERNSKIVIEEREGFRFAFLSYTYGTNGIPVKQPWQVALIDMDAIKSDITRAKAQADFVIVNYHWGDEYHLSPNSNQTSIAQQTADAGADLILGGHPHVIQPIENVTTADGRTVPVVYSLGNFISSQKKTDTLLGAMVEITISGVEGQPESLSISNIKALPLVQHYEKGYRNYRIYLLSDYTPELAKKHLANGLGAKIDISYYQSLAEKIFAGYL
ncbi:MAG: CapA family protein [Peptococcaceae bacterium]|nr:CapA family protein [Peptococcaceae bacterium]